MKKIVILLTLLGSLDLQAQQTDDFDYFQSNRTMIRNGLQAILMCNGLFTSGRTLEQVFEQELAYVKIPVGNAEGGEYLIDNELRAVAIGGPESGPVMRAAFRAGIGMRNTLASTDRFGDFIFSSQVYTTARDLARFGLLYAQGGVWQGERLISEEWIEFERTPAPASADRGRMYGGQFWLVPDDRVDVPKTAYSTAGNRGQYVVIIPSHDTVIVRRGLDFGKQGFNRWDLAREVLKAIGPKGSQ